MRTGGHIEPAPPSRQADPDQALRFTPSVQVAPYDAARSLGEFLRRSNTFEHSDTCGIGVRRRVGRRIEPIGRTDDRSGRVEQRPGDRRERLDVGVTADAAADAAPSLVVADVGAASDGGGSPWALIVGGAVLVLILGAAGLRARWNR